MVDLTSYINGIGLNSKEISRRFFRMSRVKYIISSEDQYYYKRVPGRYGGTYVSQDLFEVFKEWLNKKPLPMLNRKEYEVSEYIKSYFKKDVISQFKHGIYILDWFVPKYNLAIEFYEKEHSYKKELDIYRENFISNSFKIFIIHEKTVMTDLAILSTKYRPL